MWPPSMAHARTPTSRQWHCPLLRLRHHQRLLPLHSRSICHCPLVLAPSLLVFEHSNPDTWAEVLVPGHFGGAAACHNAAWADHRQGLQGFGWTTHAISGACCAVLCCALLCLCHAMAYQVVTVCTLVRDMHEQQLYRLSSAKLLLTTKFRNKVSQHEVCITNGVSTKTGF